MTIRLTIIVLALAIVAAGCSKKDGDPAKGASKSGLAWTPMNYADMGPNCKKALACCEDLAKQAGVVSAEDYNGKCSGPALWKEPECEADRKARVSMLEADSKPVPPACK